MADTGMVSNKWRWRYHRTMLKIDVDEITEVNFLDGATPGETSGVEVTFKNGTTRVYKGAELPEALAILNHWTPPAA